MLTDDGQFIEAWQYWGKGSVADQLAGLVPGNTVELTLIPVIPELRSGASRTISKAWFGIKSPETASDATANAAWTSASGLISITTTDTAGRGWIANESEGSPELRFYLTAANTVQLTAHKTYHWAIQVLMSDGALYEVDRGQIDTGKQVIAATS
jgi:hypothetical protein